MEQILEKLDQLSTVIGLIGTVCSVSIWVLLKTKEKFNEQRIKILLKMPEKCFKLPYEIERKYLTRSELQGLLGVLPMNETKQRYELSFLNTPDFFKNLKEAQNNKDASSIEIICYQHEEAQFNLGKMEEQCSETGL
ncbi:MAG: hypothetical protein PSN04_04295 [Methyloprofundus sp.]|nr:hypothetical protein [Methyloprofundus sp.]